MSTGRDGAACFFGLYVKGLSKTTKAHLANYYYSRKMPTIIRIADSLEKARSKRCESAPFER